MPYHISVAAEDIHGNWGDASSDAGSADLGDGKPTLVLDLVALTTRFTREVA